MQLIQEINLENLEAISIGAAILGTGGGGDPKIGYLMAKQAIEEGGPIKVVQVDEISDDCHVAALSMMGAPSVALEKMPNGGEYSLLLDKVEAHFGVEVEYLYPVEAGGINSFIPFVVAAQNNLPIIDGDTMGRAFPELQMVTFAIHDEKPFPVFLANEKLEVAEIDGDDFYQIEQQARTWTVEMGGSVSVGDGLTTGAVFKKIAIREIISLSYAIGQIVLAGNNPLDQLESVGGIRLFSGKITNVIRKTEGGFNRGVVSIEGIEECLGHSYDVHIQNENLIVFEGEKPLCMVPDLVTLLDVQTAKAITTDSLKYGQRVCALAFKCDPQWRTQKGLELVGPKAFGYQLEYVPVEELGGEQCIK